MSDSQLTPIPERFEALCGGASLRPAERRALHARYELCEDLAQQLLPTAQALLHDDGLARSDVLDRMAMALNQPESGLLAGEVQWVVGRLAELARWTP